MTLDEAIIHCEQVAREKEAFDMCDKCGLEHRQLAEWLRDYKRLKFADVAPVIHCKDCMYYNGGTSGYGVCFRREDLTIKSLKYSRLSEIVKDTDYCSRAKEREDEE